MILMGEEKIRLKAERWKTCCWNRILTYMRTHHSTMLDRVFVETKDKVQVGSLLLARTNHTSKKVDHPSPHHDRKLGGPAGIPRHHSFKDTCGAGAQNGGVWRCVVRRKVGPEQTNCENIHKR